MSHDVGQIFVITMRPRLYCLSNCRTQKNSEGRVKINTLSLNLLMIVCLFFLKSIPMVIIPRLHYGCQISERLKRSNYGI